MDIDEWDRKIICSIQNRPNSTVRELGEVIGLSHSACWKRMRRMQKAGIVSEKRHIVDTEAAGLEVVVFCFLRIAEHRNDRLSEFEEAVGRLPEVLQCYSLSGEHDYLLQVAAPSVHDYKLTVRKALLELPNVKTIDTRFTQKKVTNSKVAIF